MKLERVQVGLEIRPNEQGIPVAYPVFKDVLVESLKMTCLKSFKFWLYIFGMALMLTGIWITNIKLCIVLHTLNLSWFSWSLNNYVQYLNQYRYKVAIRG